MTTVPRGVFSRVFSSWVQFSEPGATPGQSLTACERAGQAISDVRAIAAAANRMVLDMELRVLDVSSEPIHLLAPRIREVPDRPAEGDLDDTGMRRGPLGALQRRVTDSSPGNGTGLLRRARPVGDAVLDRLGSWAARPESSTGVASRD